MEKLDLFKQFSAEYKAQAAPTVVETGPAQYMAIDGIGAPGGLEFADRVAALYSMAFTVKMTRKSEGLLDYAVGKLEALWHTTNTYRQQEWRWTLMIRTPEFVTAQDMQQAANALMRKGKSQAIGEVKLQLLNEGQCIQLLHVGPYENVGEAIQKLEAFASMRNLSIAGSHHEIYLSDARRVEPEKLKTIVRYPVKESNT